VTRRVLRQIADAAAGNPLFALELGRTLEASGPPPIGEHMAAPEELEDLVGARVAGLPGGPRRVLLAAALSADLRVPQLAAFADQHDIDEARDAGLLTIERDRVRTCPRPTRSRRSVPRPARRSPQRPQRLRVSEIS
jgi:hypothetical protein